MIMVRSINEFMRKYLPGAYEKKIKEEEERRGLWYWKKRRVKQW